MKLRFFGAAGEVTGSCTLVETDRARLVVDFGMFQGGGEAERHNRRFPPVRPDDLDVVLLTHAHLDHSGRLPMLVREGYEGKILATPATINLCQILLKDAAYLQEKDAERTSRRRMRAGKAPVYPLFNSRDAELALARLAPIPYDEAREVAPGVTARYVDAGHILGSASIELTIHEEGKGGKPKSKVIVFSGDIGPKGTPLLRDPVGFDHADALVLESTYGDRDHRPLDATLDEMIDILSCCDAGSGKALIPSFAVGRTQNLVYHLGEMGRTGVLRNPKVFVDSPMATSATTLYRAHRELFDDEAWEIINNGDSPLAFPGLKFTKSVEESMRLNHRRDGVIVISAAGMCTGGRILHHLKHGLHLPETRVIFVGYQGRGTLGRRLVDGAKVIKMFGEKIAVKASIHTLGGFSAHAGQTELIEWSEQIGKNSSKRANATRVLLNHGEDRQRRALKDRLKKDLSLDATEVQFGQIVTI